MKPALHRCIVAILFAAHIVFAQADPCKEETQKAETFYEMCVRFDPESSSYTDCVKMFMEQKTKASEICKAAPPPPEPAPVVAPVAAPAQPLASSAISQSCMSEFSALATSDFDMLGFVKKLPTEVVKVKAQLKLPFGKPADSKKTGVGITVGCLKDFPETPSEIIPLLKDVSMEMAMGIVASKAGIARNQIPTDITQLRDLAVQSGVKPVADALSFLAGGGGAEASDDEDPEEEDSGKKGVRVGIRTGFNMYDFYFGYKEMDKNTSIGKGFGAGLALNVPIVSMLRFNVGLDFYYRQLFEGKVNYPYPGGYGNNQESYGKSMYEYVVSIPALFQIGKDFYVAAGAQMDIPISTGWVSIYGSDYFSNNRSSVDFGLAAGLGYMFENFGLDFKFVYGLTKFFENFTVDYYSDRKYKDNSLLRQYGLGVSYFF
jgi:hypothetical protein